MSNRDIWEQILQDPVWMLELYAAGAFPMAPEKDSDTVQWYSPEERAVIPVNGYNIPRSVQKLLKDSAFEIRYDTAAEAVIRQCAAREKTWISEKLIAAYKRIMKLGFLHSVEAYRESELAGGLYGISIGKAFFGESMFSLIPGASKAALASLLMHLRKREYVILDVQYMTEHLAMFGAKVISMDEYSTLLKAAISEETEMHLFQE